VVQHLTKKDTQKFLTYQGSANNRLAVILIWQALEYTKFFAQYLLASQDDKKSFDAFTLCQTVLNQAFIAEIKDEHIKQLANDAHDVFNCCRDWICTYEYTSGVSASDCIDRLETACAIEKELLDFIQNSTSI
jgi:hypothetical protein